MELGLLLDSIFNEGMEVRRFDEPGLALVPVVHVPFTQGIDHVSRPRRASAERSAAAQQKAHVELSKVRESN